MIIYLARHTEVDKPKGTVILRASGYHLSQKGGVQAKSLVDYLIKQNILIERLFSSPLERCTETTQIIKTALDLSSPIEITECLNKWNRGEKSETVAERMSEILNKVSDNDLIISHHDNIQVFINKLKNEPLLQTDLHCQYGSLYKLKLNEHKKLDVFELLFIPKQ